MFTKGNRKLMLVFVVLMTCSLLLHVGCTTEEKPKTKDTLRICAERATQLNPLLYSLDRDHMRVHQMFSSLTEACLETGEIQPDLAYDWDISDCGLYFTFYLEEGVQFHRDYGELTAQDVKFSMDTYMTQEDPKPTHQAHFNDAIKNIKIIDDYTIEFEMNEASPYWMYTAFSAHRFYVLSQKAYEELGPEEFSKHLIGSGPYMFVEFLDGEKLVQEYFPNYFNGPAYFERVEWIEIPERSVQEMALLEGDIDMLLRIDNGDHYNRLLGQLDAAGLDVNVPERTNSRGIMFQIQHPPLDDKRVRHALGYLINNEEFVEHMAGGLGYPAHSNWHSSYAEFGDLQMDHPVYENNPMHVYDPEKALELLAEVGIKPGDKFPVKAVIRSDPHMFQDFLVVLQQEMRDIGIELELELYEFATMNAMRIAGETPICYFGFAGPPVIIGQMISGHHGRNIGGSNRSWYDGTDDLLDQALVELDDEKRAQIFREIRLKHDDSLHYYPIIYTGFANFWDKNIKGMWLNAFQETYPIHRLYYEE